MTSLPTIDSSEVQHITNNNHACLRAYKFCLKCEEAALEFPNELRPIRVLGYLILHAPFVGVRTEVVKSILSCDDGTSLAALGVFFEHYVIANFMKNRSRTPATSKQSPRPEILQAVNQQMIEGIKDIPKSHKAAKSKALQRDKYECVVTAPTVLTLFHYTFSGVFPEIKENSKLDYAGSTILGILKQFNYDVDKSSGEKDYALTNVLTLHGDIHDRFDELELYFEATPQENQYAVKYFGYPPSPFLRPLVTFTTHNRETHPLPSPELLALHATCCKVAQLSGAAKYVEEIYQEADETDVLASDGSSNVSDYLNLSLSKLTSRNEQ